MEMKLTPRDYHVLNVMKRQGFVAIGTEHCGTGTAAKLEHLGEADTYSFVDRKGSIRFCIVPHGSDPLRAGYVREHKAPDSNKPAASELMPRGEQGPGTLMTHTNLYSTEPEDIADMIRSAQKILQYALDKVEAMDHHSSV